MSDQPNNKDMPVAQQIGEMGIPEKIRLALLGGKEARTILARQNNKNILFSLVQNPRITEQEVLQLAKDKNMPQDVLVALAKRKEWIKKYSIRLALACNAKTPLPVVLKLLNTLKESDLRRMGRSKDVSAQAATSARRVLSRRE